MTTYPNIELALIEAYKQTKALRISDATDGVNLVKQGFGMYGLPVFKIYKSYNQNMKLCYKITYADID